MIPIFLSRPNPYTNEQAYFLKQIIRILNKAGLQNVTLEAADYNPYESLSCINELIKRCYGMLIIAFGQYYIDTGISKKDAIYNTHFFDSRETSLTDTWITSPFCHIEGALGFHHQIPILLIEQEQLKIEGILKDGSHAIKGPQFSLKSNAIIDEYINSSALTQAISLWAEKVIEKHNFIHNKID